MTAVLVIVAWAAGVLMGKGYGYARGYSAGVRSRP